jgi:hypothetical protein
MVSIRSSVSRRSIGRGRVLDSPPDMLSAIIPLGAFSDAEVIHVEGDVDPIRDMNIISTELRLKDIEWVEKQIEMQKKSSRSAGNNSLEDRKKKEDLAIMEKVLDHVGVQNKDVRKGDWGSREVSAMVTEISSICNPPRSPHDEQESIRLSISNPALRGLSSHMR